MRQRRASSPAPTRGPFSTSIQPRSIGRPRLLISGGVTTRLHPIEKVVDLRPVGLVAWCSAHLELCVVLGDQPGPDARRHFPDAAALELVDTNPVEFTFTRRLSNSHFHHRLRSDEKTQQMQCRMANWMGCRSL